MKRFLIYLILCIPCVSYAAHNTEGIGFLANNLMEPVTIFSAFISSASLVIGVFFLFAAFVKYMEHRVNPLYAPMSTVVLLFVGGAVLVLLPLIYRLTQGGIPFSFFH